MKKRLRTICSAILLFCLPVAAVELGIERNGDCVTLFTTNNTFRCAMTQWVSDIGSTNWVDYHGYIAGGTNPAVREFSFEIKANAERVFWRLNECQLTAVTSQTSKPEEANGAISRTGE